MAVITLDDWKALSQQEQFEAWKKWNPYTGEGLEELQPAILKAFSSEYPELASVEWGNVHGEFQIVVDPGLSPFPSSFMGIPVRRRTDRGRRD